MAGLHLINGLLRPLCRLGGKHQAVGSTLCSAPEGAAASSLPSWHTRIDSTSRGSLLASPRPPDTLPLLPRCGLALALNKLSQCLDSSQVKPLFQFFVPDALNDRNPDVRKCMLDAALATLNAHGKVRNLSQQRG